MKREIYAGLVIVCSMTAAMFSWAQGPDPEPIREQPTPAQDRFVEVYEQNPLAFNARVFSHLDTETTATVAQKYNVVKDLAYLEASAGRSTRTIVSQAPSPLRTVLKSVTAATLVAAKAQAEAAVLVMDAKTSEALSEN